MNWKSCKKKNKKGFSLVELIIVMMIMAILAAVLVPSLTSYIRKTKESMAVVEAHDILVGAQASLTQQYAMGGLSSDSKKYQYFDTEQGKWVTIKCGTITNFMLFAAYYNDTYKSSLGGNAKDFAVAKTLLQYVNASGDKIQITPNSQYNPMGVNCKAYCNNTGGRYGKGQRPMGLIFVFDTNGKIVFMQYYTKESGILVTFENGDYTTDSSDSAKFRNISY